MRFCAHGIVIGAPILQYRESDQKPFCFFSLSVKREIESKKNQRFCDVFHILLSGEIAERFQPWLDDGQWVVVYGRVSIEDGKDDYHPVIFRGLDVDIGPTPKGNNYLEVIR